MAIVAELTGADLHRLSLPLVPVSERLAGALDILPGERVIDIAGGTGNTALAAARRYAEVTCVDTIPQRLDMARRRGEMEGLLFDTLVADPQSLPFPDSSFDVATSAFGLMFAPDQEQTAAELARVVRPGGRVGITTWTPAGLGGAVLDLIGRHTPPEPRPSVALRWGTAEGLGALLRPHVSGLRTERRLADVTAPDLDALFERYRTSFGPVAALLATLDAAGVAEFEREWRELWQRFNRMEDGPVVAPAEYLEIVAVR